MPDSILWWVAFAIVCFIQNMAFTWTSRSRNSNDIAHHFKAAISSNGVWLLAQLFVWKGFWTLFYEGTMWVMLPMAGVYVLMTALGSCFMMALMTGKFTHPWLVWFGQLFKESGDKRVGAHKK